MLAQDFTTIIDLAAKAFAHSAGYRRCVFKQRASGIPEASASVSGPALHPADLLGDRLFPRGFSFTSPGSRPAIERARSRHQHLVDYAPDDGHRSSDSSASPSGSEPQPALEGNRQKPTTSGLALRHIEAYFDELGAHLDNQYLLTFNGSGGRKDDSNASRRQRAPKVEFLAPSQAFLPPASRKGQRTRGAKKQSKGAVRLVCGLWF